MSYLRIQRNIYELQSPAGRWLGSTQSLKSAKRLAEQKLKKTPQLKEILIIKPIGYVHPYGRKK
jgi:hypothetical protein